PLVEDAAEALGSLYHGRPCGSFGLVSAISFNGNKIVTTGGGGAVLTNDAALARRAKHLTTTAKRPGAFEFFHDEVGFNYRLPNINAALGCAQLERLESMVARKRALAETYAREFAEVAGMRIMAEPAGCRGNYWLNAVLLEPEVEHLRDAVLEATHQAGFMTRPAWNALHTLPMYRACPAADLSVTDSLVRRIVNLPSGPALVGP
ncbi:MAG: DegT/DnrJ/EryC1/StrS family aminotransferase, partial [Magnetospirillum sp.]|nr:DegT/DnrJ/EryC1/StrS family aminotransferase [Magnetospirillum sp.]